MGRQCGTFASGWMTAAEAPGNIDAAKMMEVFDLPLFNEDGTFREKGGPAKVLVEHVDLTSYQIVTDLNELQVWLKIPRKGGGTGERLDSCPKKGGRPQRDSRRTLNQVLP